MSAIRIFGQDSATEEQVLNREFKCSDDVSQLEWDEERIVRMAMHAALVDVKFCGQLRDLSRKSLLDLPTYYRRN